MERLLTGEAVRALRERLGLSQHALAHMLWISTTTVHRWEVHPTDMVPATGGALVFLRALHYASLREPDLRSKLADLRDDGDFNFWARIFTLAYEQIVTAKRPA